MKGKQIRPRMSQGEYDMFLKLVKKQENNVLVVGDLHAPFTREGYLEHCIATYKKYNCNKVIFIGDIVDHHYASYHETNPDGMGAGDELDGAIAELAKWYKAFPEATVILGNHDLLVYRKTFSAGLSRRWVKPFEEVLEVPNWKFVEEYEFDGVLYLHGTGTSGANAAFKRAQNISQSVVMGHVHTEASIRWNATRHERYFGLMVGCGVDEKAYAMEYGRNFPKKMIISCGVVADNGQVPIVVPMNLD